MSQIRQISRRNVFEKKKRFNVLIKHTTSYDNLFRDKDRINSDFCRCKDRCCDKKTTKKNAFNSTYGGGENVPERFSSRETCVYRCLQREESLEIPKCPPRLNSGRLSVSLSDLPFPSRRLLRTKAKSENAERMPARLHGVIESRALSYVIVHRGLCSRSTRYTCRRFQGRAMEVDELLVRRRDVCIKTEQESRTKEMHKSEY